MEAAKARLEKNTRNPVIDISNCLKAAQVFFTKDAHVKDRKDQAELQSHNILMISSSVQGGPKSCLFLLKYHD